LAIGRQNRPELYALVPTKPEPLIPRKWRFGVRERISSQGEILEELDEGEIKSIFYRLLEERTESVAICLLFSYLMPKHEERIRELIRDLEQVRDDSDGEHSNDRLHISLSSDVLPEFREYERASTTVINAYVAPVMDRYLSQLNRELAPRPLTVMQSNGGIINASTAGSQAARTVLSGPAGGVVGARFVAETAGFSDIITFDMGGTSTDVALCPGRLPKTSEGEISGMPLRLPMIDIQTIGAGGGSLAAVDAGGALRVGPQSAGADPGPACYTQSLATDPIEATVDDLDALYTRATTTDANLVLGRLDAQHFLGGTRQLNQDAAVVVMTWLAEQMGVSSPEEAAWGVVRVANANMARVIRRISVERGFDPRYFTLVAFGGAGPLHACELAEDLQIPRVIIPRVPGVLSALGMLIAKPAKDYSLTVMQRIEPESESGVDWLERNFVQLEKKALADMAIEGYSADEIDSIRQLDMRYLGQSHELTISVSPGFTSNSITDHFHQSHQRRFMYHRPEAAVEVVNLRIISIAQIVQPQIDWQVSKTPIRNHSTSEETAFGQKEVWFEGARMPCELFQREELPERARFHGPALIFQYDTTIVIPPHWQANVDQFGNIILTFRVE
jgi:N-methylhydantoinase A